MNNFLLEIGTEEIPAGYIEPALTALAASLAQKLTAARIAHGEIRTCGTPRRLVAMVADMAPKQENLVTDMVGPPARVGFDPQGQPTVAARKFAHKAGVAVKALRIVETPKGRYLSARIKERGVASRGLLKGMLPEVILSLPFPKTMRWGDLALEFARPIHTLVALLGDSLVSFRLGNVKSGRHTWGHRFMHPGKIRLAHADEYVECLRQAEVLVDQNERKARVAADIATAARQLGGTILPDQELVDIVSHLVERPEVVTGRFDTRFLELPDEVLITAMREHQKYFAVVDAQRKLLPGFVVVNNTRAKDMALVAKGHERVLRARLQDARFFYESDIGVSLEKLVPKLKKVLFQAQLGSLYEKTLRIKALAEVIADQTTPAADDPGGALKQHAARAAWLCKADLVSQMVIEFPKLQGIMGRVYAAAAGEPQAVAAAIEEHYCPTRSGGPLPQTPAGAMVAIADKIDTICGCFCAGLIPTGGADPYALRRQAIGIVQIMHSRGFAFSLKSLVAQSLAALESQRQPADSQTSAKVMAFLQSRIEHLLVEDGFSKDVIAAVVSVSVDHVPNVWQRVRSLEALKSQPDFDALAIAFKRVVNIIRKAGAEATAEVSTDLFTDPSEHRLHALYRQVADRVQADLAAGQFRQALLSIASMRDAVDAFFNEVLVMAEDSRLRHNRLGLLKQIADLFAQVADFSKLST